MLKKISFVLAGIIILLVIVGFFLPSKYELIKSIAINAPAAYVFEEVNELKNWDRWSYWNQQDTAMAKTWGEKTAGTGAWYSWNSEEMGEGKLTISESVTDASVKTDLDFMEQGTALSWFNFKPQGEQTEVTIGFSTDFGYNIIGRWMGVTLFSGEMEKAFDHNLAMLKELAEAKPKFTTMIMEAEAPAITYIGLSHTMSPQDPDAASAQMRKMYTELYAALAKAKVQASGAPFCLFTSYSEQSMDFICGVPVASDAKLPAKYPIKSTTSTAAVKGIHNGSYRTLQTAHNEIQQYIKMKKLEEEGAVREVYLTDPEMKKDTAKWVTEVYYPIKK